MSDDISPTGAAPSVPPLLPASVTFISGLAVVILHGLPSLAIYVAALFTLLAITSRAFSSRVLRTFCYFLLLTALPVFLMQSLFNTAFPITARIGGIIPWRPEGINYGSIVAARFILIGVVAAHWASVSRGELVDELQRLHMPLSVVMVIFQGLAIAKLIERRIEAVYLAQRARGIPVGPGLVARLKAVPPILIPVTIGAIIEAEMRVPALVSRGFGSQRLLVPPRRHLTLPQASGLVLLALALTLAILAKA